MPGARASRRLPPSSAAPLLLGPPQLPPAAAAPVASSAGSGCSQSLAVTWVGLPLVWERRDDTRMGTWHSMRSVRGSAAGATPAGLRSAAKLGTSVGWGPKSGRGLGLREAEAQANWRLAPVQPWPPADKTDQ